MDYAAFEALVAKVQWNARVNEKLFAHLLEPVPPVPMPACLTEDMVGYLHRICNLCRKKTGKCGYDDILRAVLQGSKVVTSQNDPDRDGRILWHMLAGLLPPCSMSEEHVQAFDEYVRALRKAEKKQQFRNEVFEWAVKILLA